MSIEWTKTKYIFQYILFWALFFGEKYEGTRERERWRERRRAGVEEWSGPAGRSVCVSGAVRGCRRGNNHFQQPFVSVHFLSPSFVSSSIPHFGLQPSFDRFLLFKFSSLFCVGFCFCVLCRVIVSPPSFLSVPCVSLCSLWQQKV